VTPSNDVAIYAPYAARLYGPRPNDQVAGGAELQTTLLAHGLVERGLRVVHVIYPTAGRYPPEPTTPALVERSEHRGGLGGLREAATIWRSLMRADAEVCIVRGSGGHVVPCAAYTRVRGRKLVFSASNDLDFDFDDRTDRTERVLNAYRRGVERSDRMIVQTGQQRELAKAAFPDLDPLLIPSFCQPAEPSTGDDRYFLWADRFVDYKRPEIFVELAENLPDIRFRMVAPMTGATDAAFAASLRERAAKLPNFELLPGMQRPQVLEQISRATALVKTSLVEGMPNTFLEAWARSVPVLSFAVDPDSRIVDNDAGILAHGDMRQLADGARRLWDDPALRAQLGANGLRFVDTTHSPAAVADSWYEVLQPLLDRPRS
jgi:glycosyltransferase involved in cell wall biosynthesis